MLPWVPFVGEAEGVGGGAEGGKERVVGGAEGGQGKGWEKRVGEKG
jgi:hypothetical protein